MTAKAGLAKAHATTTVRADESVFIAMLRASNSIEPRSRKDVCKHCARLEIELSALNQFLVVSSPPAKPPRSARSVWQTIIRCFDNGRGLKGFRIARQSAGAASPRDQLFALA
jgi:hypothetical protein